MFRQPHFSGPQHAQADDMSTSAAGGVVAESVHSDRGLLGAYPSVVSTTGFQKSASDQAYPDSGGFGNRLVQRMRSANRGPRSLSSGIWYAANYRTELAELQELAALPAGEDARAALQTARFQTWDGDLSQGYSSPEFFDRPGFMEWTLRRGQSASAGIRAWLRGLTIAECGCTAVACALGALQETLGSARFDELFGSTHGDPEIELLHICPIYSMSSTERFAENIARTRDTGPGTKGNRPVKVGDRFYFKNFRGYKLKHPGGDWAGETAIYVGKKAGKQMWMGFGTTELTEHEMNQKMVAEYNRPRGERDAARLSAMLQRGPLPPEYDPINGAFEDQITLGMLEQEGGLQWSSGESINLDRATKRRTRVP